MLLIANIAHAQDHPIINYTTQAGLPSNNIYSITQDRLGYIWITTDNGLVKYNGYSYRVFTSKDGLNSNDIWRISEDNLGNMWVFSSYSKHVGYIKNDKYHIAYQDSITIIYRNLFHRADFYIF